MLSAAGNLPYKLVVDDAACRRCRRCLAGDICRGHAFVRFDRTDSPFIDMSKCWGCLICTPTCPFGAILREDYGEQLPSLSD